MPLQAGEEAEYMLALKQEFRGAMKTLPFYIRPAAPKKGQFRVEDELFTGIYKVTMIFFFFTECCGAYYKLFICAHDYLFFNS